MYRVVFICLSEASNGSLPSSTTGSCLALLILLLGFESYSEDPFLSGTLAGEYCKGVQEEDVMTTPKHYVCNDQEDDRMGVNSIVTDRALREVYLMPFMLCIKAARPAAVMAAYNKVNGIHCAENPVLLDILRKEWKWEGLLMSDW